MFLKTTYSGGFQPCLVIMHKNHMCSCVVRCCDMWVCRKLKDVTGWPGSPAGLSHHRHVAFTYLVFLCHRLLPLSANVSVKIVLPVLYDFVPFLFISLLLLPCFSPSWALPKSFSLKENSLATVTKHTGLRSQAWLAPHILQ